MLYLSSVQFGHKSNVNQPKTQTKQDKNACRACKCRSYMPFAASRRDTRHRQKANAAKAIAPPTYPTEAPDKKLDYIFVDTRHNWETVNVEIPQISLSDHLPVVCKLLLTKP